MEARREAEWLVVDGTGKSVVAGTQEWHCEGTVMTHTLMLKCSDGKVMDGTVMAQ